ncbi:MAG TPA: ATP-binding protein [Mycobacterium sp.]|nr:ATP-binding protein [Mycobacterium sp.]
MVGESAIESGAGLNASRRIAGVAETVGLLMRNCVNLLVTVTTLLDPQSMTQPPGNSLLALLAGWSTYRILTRSTRRPVLVVDYAFVVAVCVSLPLLVPNQDFYTRNTAAQAIAGTAVIGFSVAASPPLSIPMTAGIATAYAWGSAGVLGWNHIAPVAALYYFALQWITAALIRIMLLRVAAAVDRARTARVDAEVSRQVTDAVRDYEREQLALLHDTAAVTLTIVGHESKLPPQRLAAQASRDLELLEKSPWQAAPRQVELVSALHECARHITTPVRFDGLTHLWLKGGTANTVTFAAREAMNNVDRHAKAKHLTLTVNQCSVILTDNGIGFDPHAPRSGHGVTDSILARMHRIGGKAEVRSVRGEGTTIKLYWPTEPTKAEVSLPPDPERLIERIRARYGLALVAYALANLAFAVPQAVIYASLGVLEAALGALAAAATLAAVPRIHRNRAWLMWLAGGSLLVVTVLQPALLGPGMAGGYAHWAQSAIGWCVLPLVLGLPTRTGAAIIAMYWLVGATVEFMCAPTDTTLVNIGLGTASILGVQLFALAFNGLMRTAASDAEVEVQLHTRLALRDQVERALRAEYQHRYAELVDNVIPILRALSEGTPVDEELQARARAQARRMRVLFDQAATFEHPLMRAIRPMVDAAEERRVAVTVDLVGPITEIVDVDFDALLRPIAMTMAETNESARIVVTSSQHEISVSIVCRGLACRPTLPVDPNVRIDIIESSDSFWVLVSRLLPSDGAPTRRR